MAQRSPCMIIGCGGYYERQLLGAGIGAVYEMICTDCGDISEVEDDHQAEFLDVQAAITVRKFGNHAPESRMRETTAARWEQRRGAAFATLRELVSSMQLSRHAGEKAAAILARALETDHGYEMVYSKATAAGQVFLMRVAAATLVQTSSEMCLGLTTTALAGHTGALARDILRTHAELYQRRDGDAEVETLGDGDASDLVPTDDLIAKELRALLERHAFDPALETLLGTGHTYATPLRDVMLRLAHTAEAKQDGSLIDDHALSTGVDTTKLNEIVDVAYDIAWAAHVINYLPVCDPHALWYVAGALYVAARCVDPVWRHHQLTHQLLQAISKRMHLDVHVTKTAVKRYHDTLYSLMMECSELARHVTSKNFVALGHMDHTVKCIKGLLRRRERLQRGTLKRVLQAAEARPAKRLKTDTPTAAPATSVPPSPPANPAAAAADPFPSPVKPA